MSGLVLPTFAGLAFPWVRSPTFQTRKQVNISGKEVRIADWSSPRYTWELAYEVLRQGTILGTFTEWAQMEAFFESLLGGYDSWLYKDPDDFQVTGQLLGVGVSGQLVYPLLRTIASGGLPVPVLAPNTSLTINVYINAVLQSGASYTITNWTSSNTNGPGKLIFGSQPTVGQQISIDMQYYWPVRFDDDSLSFSKFMSNLYELKKMSFTSIK